MARNGSRARATPRGTLRSSKRPAMADPAPPPDAKKPKGPIESTEPVIKDQTIPQTVSQTIFFTEKPAVIEERNGEIEIRVVNNDGSAESTVVLIGLKSLFQLQLPQMPPAYLTRLVFDRSHLSIAIVRKPLEVIGGITFRPFRERKFAEIVFCAISADNQDKGYGGHIMNHLKDYVKSTSSIMTFLTYADNLAIGYFQKQGFTKEITLDRKIWAGMIKDYEGGTMMQCTMLPRIRYLQVARMLALQKASIQAKIRTFNQNHVIHQPPQQWANGVVPIDPLSIPAIKATGWSPAMDELSRQPRRSARFHEIQKVLNKIQNNKQAWPFLKPVDQDEVPDYYNVISYPIDLETIEEKLDKDEDYLPKNLVDDLKLMFENCRTYNDSNTTYAKCAANLEKYMWKLVKEIPEWHDLIEK